MSAPPTGVGGATSSSSSSGQGPRTSTAGMATPPTLEVPAAARAHTPAGAEAFVRYFNDVYTAALTKPDATLLPMLCDTNSKSCAAFQKTATELVIDGRRYRSAPLTLRSVTSVKGPSGDFEVLVGGQQNLVDIVDSNGTVISTDPQRSFEFMYYPRWAGSTWVMHDVKLVSAA